MPQIALMLRSGVAISLVTCVAWAENTYPIVDTNQVRAYDEQYEIALTRSTWRRSRSTEAAGRQKKRSGLQ